MEYDIDKIVCDKCGGTDFRFSGDTVRDHKLVKQCLCKNCLKMFVPKPYIYSDKNKENNKNATTA